MSKPIRTQVSGVDVERGACGLCHEMGVCAAPRGSELRFCFLCALSMAQLVASHLRAARRPHRAPCTCEACITFDEGQRGEVANVALIDGRDVSRWSVLEVDP
jgi:hypothetical protein